MEYSANNMNDLKERSLQHEETIDDLRNHIKLSKKYQRNKSK